MSDHYYPPYPCCGGLTLKYGQRLTPDDGRDSLRDAYHEALELAVYLRKALYERDGR